MTLSITKTLATAAVAVIASTTITYAAAIDLRTWTKEDYSGGAGSWVPEASAGAYVDQNINGNPTVYYSDFDATNKRVEGKIQVRTTGDDDFIGFVLGWDAGDFTSATADYLLLDWKQGNQGAASRGLALNRISGRPGSANDYWAHIGGVTELARAATLGDTGWADNTEYEFTIDFFTTNVKVWVDGVLQFNIAGSFDGGAVGFYNYSQGTVRYSAFEETQAPPPVPSVVEPGTAGLIGLSLMGLAAAGRRRKA